MADDEQLDGSNQVNEVTSATSSGTSLPLEIASTGYTRRDHKIVSICALLLFLVTAGVFWPACRNDFVNWDDHLYVVEQPNVVDGLKAKSCWWAMTANVAGNWHPLTLLSLQLDAHLFGIDASRFHRTSVVLHAVNASLVFLTLYSLTGATGRSVIAAALFALHPLRVESVAWISERKDVLSGLFFLLVLITYAGYARRPTAFRYVLAFVFFALGLMSKSMLVTTPCVLMLLDVWPLGRWNRLGRDSSDHQSRLIVEKLPLFALSFFTSIVILSCQKEAFDTTEHSPLLGRFSNAIVSTVVYLGQTIWPVNLSPYYGLHEISVPSLISATVVLLVLTTFAIYQRRQQPFLLIGWLWFLGMLVPVSGLIQVGTQSHADRYLYLPHIGLFLGAVWLVASIVQQSLKWTRLSLCFTAGLLFISCLLTNRQIAIWHDTESLWRHAYRLDPYEALVVQQNFIKELISNEKKSEALQITRDCIEVADRSHPRALIWLANLLAVQGEHQSCVETLTQALGKFPDEPEVYSSRGKMNAGLGRWQEAATDFRRVIELSPNSAAAVFHLAYVLEKLGDPSESRRMYDRVLVQIPNFPKQMMSDAWRLSTSPSPLDRLALWPICLAEQAIEAAGTESPEALDILAAAQANAGQFDSAVTTARRAIELARSQRLDVIASGIEHRLALYEKREPFRRQSRIAMR